MPKPAPEPAGVLLTEKDIEATLIKAESSHRPYLYLKELIEIGFITESEYSRMVKLCRQGKKLKVCKQAGYNGKWMMKREHLKANLNYFLHNVPIPTHWVEDEVDLLKA